MKKLAVVITHPVQYYTPLFALINSRKKIDLKVFYTWSQWQKQKYDAGFQKEVEWDIPLLEGYDYQFVENESSNPGLYAFNGIRNPELISLIQNWQPDAVLVFGWNYHSHLKVMRHFKGKIPVFFRGDSTLLDETNAIKSVLRRIFLKWVYSHVDKAFYVGSNNKDYYLKHGLQPDQLIYAPHAVDNSRFDEKYGNNYENEAQQWRKTLGIHEDDILVLFAGKFESKKAPDLLLQAFQNTENKGNLKLLFAGNGPKEKALKEKAGNGDNIKFIPFQNQQKMPVVYRLGDIFCLPSRGPGETWGLALNEALASGRPVIASDKVGGATDLIVNDKNGFIFPSGNPDALENILSGLEKNSLGKLKKEAKPSIHNFNFENIVSSVEKEVLNV